MRPHVPSKYKSYALTVRPLDGATSVHDDLLCQFAQKYCEYYYIVSEKLDSERHLHAGLFFKKTYTRSALSMMIKRVYKDLSDDEKRVLNQGLRIMYNFDFIENYLDKDDDTELLLKNLPEKAHLEGYWPPSKDQDKAKAVAATDKFYANLEYLWYQHVPPGVECSKLTTQSFLFDMMFNKRLIKVMRDRKAIITTSEMLYWYITKTSTAQIEPAPWEQ